jgi:hypothetical protein
LAQVIHNRENLTRVRAPAAGCHVSRLTRCGSGSQVSPDGGPPGVTGQGRRQPDALEGVTVSESQRPVPWLGHLQPDPP